MVDGTIEESLDARTLWLMARIPEDKKYQIDKSDVRKLLEVKRDPHGPIFRKLSEVLFDLIKLDLWSADDLHTWWCLVKQDYFYNQVHAEWLKQTVKHVVEILPPSYS